MRPGLGLHRSGFREPAAARSLKVSYGPCGASVFDSTKVEFDAGELNEAAARLGRAPTAAK
ncbi:hypothetical protein SAMN05216371_8099 [Streptomyces sp. TLI_053]|nr:hypothetical protein SAMN05216371_8099 [Streptomyces sp. TLI_053]